MANPRRSTGSQSFGRGMGVAGLECFYHFQKGHCKWGNNCKYSHEHTGIQAEEPRQDAFGPTAGNNSRRRNPVYTKWQGRRDPKIYHVSDGREMSLEMFGQQGNAFSGAGDHVAVEMVGQSMNTRQQTSDEARTKIAHAETLNPQHSSFPSTRLNCLQFPPLLPQARRRSRSPPRANRVPAVGPLRYYINGTSPRQSGSTDTRPHDSNSRILPLLASVPHTSGNSTFPSYKDSSVLFEADGSFIITRSPRHLGGSPILPQDVAMSYEHSSGHFPEQALGGEGSAAEGSQLNSSSTHHVAQAHQPAGHPPPSYGNGNENGHPTDVPPLHSSEAGHSSHHTIYAGQSSTSGNPLPSQHQHIGAMSAEELECTQQQIAARLDIASTWLAEVANMTANIPPLLRQAGSLASVEHDIIHLSVVAAEARENSEMLISLARSINRCKMLIEGEIESNAAHHVPS